MVMDAPPFVYGHDVKQLFMIYMLTQGRGGYDIQVDAWKGGGV